jgi:hypothetical protein
MKDMTKKEILKAVAELGGWSEELREAWDRAVQRGQ